MTLALEPAKRPGVAFVTLLDEAEFRLEADGRGLRRRRQVVQLLTDAAARARAEQSFSYSPSHQAMTLNWVRVLKRSGEVISDKPAQEQDADVPVAMRNPVYQDQKVRRLSLAGMSAGVILDISWTIEEKGPYRTGDFYDLWFVNATNEVLRSRYALDMPAAFQPRIVERNLRIKRSDSTANGRRVVSWAASNLDAVRFEPFAADSNGIVQSITVAAPGSWNDIAQWYHGLSNARYVFPQSVADRVDSVVRASRARTRTDTIKALHRWVAQDIRYVSVALGIGGYQPRTAADVLSTGFGDCKDKATLFVAALRKFGIEANTVLLAQSGRSDRNMPSIYQFDHAIAAVRSGAGWTYTDLTAEAIPYGMIPLGYQGAMGLMVARDGTGQEVRFPLSQADSNTSVVSIEGALQADGQLVVRVEDIARGASSLGARAAFYAPLDSARTAAALRAIGNQYFKDAAADSLITFDGRDLTSEARMAFRVSASAALRTVGTYRLLPMPGTLRGPAQSFGTLASNLAAMPPRKFPVDVSRLVGPSTTITQLQLTLPEGWTAEQPKNVVASSIAGRYESRYSQEGRVLRISRRIEGARGIYAPERIAEVIAWLRAIAADDLEFLQLKPPG